MVGGWPVGYLHNPDNDLNLGLPRTNPDSSRLKDLHQGLPDFKSSTLNHLATPPPCSDCSLMFVMVASSLEVFLVWQFNSNAHAAAALIASSDHGF